MHARGRRVLGVHDLAEPASRAHLAAVEVDAVIETDAGPDAFVRALVALGSQRGPTAAGGSARRARLAPGRLVVVGGPPGVGRTEIAIELAISTARDIDVRASSTATMSRPRSRNASALALEPNLRTAIDAVEHGRGDLAVGGARPMTAPKLARRRRHPEPGRLGAGASRAK